MRFPTCYRSENIFRKQIFREKRRYGYQPRKINKTLFRNPTKFLCFLMQLILIILPTEAVIEDYKNKNDNYDYYGDYDSMDDDSNYAELGPAAYDYNEKSELVERPKKSNKDYAEAEGDLAQNCEDSNDCEAEVSATTCAPTGSSPTTTAATVTSTVCATPSTAPDNSMTTCKTLAPSAISSTLAPECLSIDKAFQTPQFNHDQPVKAKELRDLVQHLYISQARVQLEASEIKKAQAIANEAQQQLEEAANHVRAVTAALQNAQQEVATSAIRAQTAQLQLAAHDQLLFAARQDVDALSSRMVGLQAAEGIAQPQVNFDIGALMEKLRQPLMDGDKPTPVPSIAVPNSRENSPAKTPSDFYYDDDYEDY